MTLSSIPDFFATLVWLLTTALVAASCWRVSTRLFPRDDVLAHLFHTLLLAWAALVAASFLLSVFGLLYPVLLAALLAGGAIKFSSRSKGRFFIWSSRQRRLKNPIVRRSAPVRPGTK